MVNIVDLEKVKDHTIILRNRIDELLEEVDLAIEENEEEIKNLDIKDIHYKYKMIQAQMKRLGRFIK